jgi:hypothetical protein
MRIRPLLFVSSASLLLTGLLVNACSDSTRPAPVDVADARPDRGTSTDPDPVDPEEDAGTDAPTGRNPDGPGVEGEECSFNHNCKLALRCECDEDAPAEEPLCACRPGERGTMKLGESPCTDGNDCESSLCLDGPNDVSTCSDECDTKEDCPANLPVCIAVTGVGKFCKREVE